MNKLTMLLLCALIAGCANQPKKRDPASVPKYPVQPAGAKKPAGMDFSIWGERLLEHVEMTKENPDGIGKVFKMSSYEFDCKGTKNEFTAKFQLLEGKEGFRTFKGKIATGKKTIMSGIHNLPFGYAQEGLSEFYYYQQKKFPHNAGDSTFSLMFYKLAENPENIVNLSFEPGDFDAAENKFVNEVISDNGRVLKLRATNANYRLTGKGELLDGQANCLVTVKLK